MKITGSSPVGVIIYPSTPMGRENRLRTGIVRVRIPSRVLKDYSAIHIKNEPFFRGLGSTPALNSRRSANNSLVLMWDWYNGYYSCLPEHISLLCVEEAGDGSSILLSHTKGSCYVHYGVSTGSGSFLYQ